MSGIDFAVAGRTEVRDTAELVEFLRDARPRAVRLAGRGEHQDRVPAPPQPVWLVGLAAMQGIVRLDPGDLTCSVEAGLPRAVLDAELAKYGLVLPCPGDGTLGGLFARGEHAPLSPTALTARNVLLGLDGVRRDGTTFKVGARVVKSVAGFDVHRAFVGSRGRLFAATTLHLKLRPAPRAELVFCTEATEPTAALDLWRELRALPTAPSELVLERCADGSCRIGGRIEGAAAHVRAVQSHFALHEGPPLPLDQPRRDADVELLDGLVQPSALGQLLERLPPRAVLRASGSGQFLTWLAPREVDALMLQLPGLPGGCAEIRCGPAARRGRTTPVDPVAAELAHAVRRELDPSGSLQ